MTEALRVLLVEDSPTDARLLMNELRGMGRQIFCERVETAEAMRAALAEKEWDLVISDWSLPRFSAPAALGVLKEAGLDIPFIIVSGTIGEEIAVDAMRAGARDYVLKDKLGRLSPAIERELRECRERNARRQVELALKESERRFRGLSDSGIIGITIADLRGSILDANAACLGMLDYAREQLVGGSMRWADLTPRELGPLVRRAASQLRASGAAAPWEMELLRRDGSRVPVLVGVATLDYPRCIAFVADLTERRQAEAGRYRAEAALRQSEEQLRQAQKMEAVGRLAGGVAHDFNNILSVILSYGELMLASLGAADPMREDIEEVYRAAERAAGLTRQLLLFSRQPIIEPKVVDLNEVLTGMTKMLTRIIGEDVDLTLLTPPGLGRVKVDPTHIEQVILNLVVNARDAMPQGGKLGIETANAFLDQQYAREHLSATAGRHVMVAVTDTGTGMDSATKSRIFEPFFTTKEKGQGTGLGLSTVFGIVQQSGGSILVESEPGRGATFKVYLPMVDAQVDAPRAEVTFRTLQGSETILLVEDEEQVRTVAVRVLRGHGYRIMVAQHPGEALLLCEKESGAIDLLVTDVVMPHMSGPELARRVTTTRPQLKVLFVSGYTDDSMARHGVLESGMAFLQKPFTPDLLTRKVRQVLDGAALVAARAT